MVQVFIRLKNEKIKPLYDILKLEILSSEYIQVDESTVPVIGYEKTSYGQRLYVVCQVCTARSYTCIYYILNKHIQRADVDPRKWMTDVLRKLPIYKELKMDIKGAIAHELEKQN